MNRKQKIMLVRIVAAAAMMIGLEFAPVEGVVRFLLYLVPYLVIGYDILKKAVRGILNRQVFDENFLMAVATVGAIALALYDRSGDYTEAVAVMLFYQIGEWFQSYAVGRSRKNISELMDIRPDYANIEKDGVLEQVDPDEVAIGSVIVVQPGEKVPIDGVVIEGTSSLNTSALTGESVPRDITAGHEVISGCINLTGVLKIRTTKEFGESTVSQILDLVENASSRKSRSEDFISKFARVYTPAVCYAALALAILPPLVRIFGMGLAPEWDVWIYRALTFLVISCPCALVISIPLSFFAGLGAPAGKGSSSRAPTIWKRWRRRASSFSTRPVRSPRAYLRSMRCITAESTNPGCWNMRRWRRAPPPIPSARVCRRPTAGKSTAPAYRTCRRSAGTAFWPWWTASALPQAMTSS